MPFQRQLNRLELALPSLHKRNEESVRYSAASPLETMKLTQWPSLWRRAGKEQDRTIALPSDPPCLDLQLQFSELRRVQVACRRVIQNRFARAIHETSHRPV